MNIIFGPEQASEAEKKYTVLELDTVRVLGHDRPITAYCVVESVPIIEMSNIEQMRELHKNLMQNYRRRNWKYCEDAVEHLMGKWNRELDSFYKSLMERVYKFKLNDPGDDWDGTLEKN